MILLKHSYCTLDFTQARTANNASKRLDLAQGGGPAARLLLPRCLRPYRRILKEHGRQYREHVGAGYQLPIGKLKPLGVAQAEVAQLQAALAQPWPTPKSKQVSKAAALFRKIVSDNKISVE